MSSSLVIRTASLSTRLISSSGIPLSRRCNEEVVVLGLINGFFFTTPAVAEVAYFSVFGSMVEGSADRNTSRGSTLRTSMSRSGQKPSAAYPCSPFPSHSVSFYLIHSATSSEPRVGTGKHILVQAHNRDEFRTFHCICYAKKLH
jgi:hypothetical protein